jgi:hypothetical protein
MGFLSSFSTYFFPSAFLPLCEQSNHFPFITIHDVSERTRIMTSGMTTAWSSTLRKSVPKLTDAQLIERFVSLLFSDRAILPLQWASEMVRHRVILDPDRLALWFDDVLTAPLALQVSWTMSERQIKSPSGISYADGTLYCFGTRPGRDELEVSRFYFVRPLSMLDGYTLMLFSELLKRQPSGFSFFKRDHTVVEMQYVIPIPESLLHSDAVLHSRQRLLSHLFLALLALPLVMDHELDYAVFHLMLSAIQRYLTRRLLDRTLPVWLQPMLDVFERFYSMRRSDLETCFGSLACPCMFCSHIKPLFLETRTGATQEERSEAPPEVDRIIIDTVTRRMLEEHRKKRELDEWRRIRLENLEASRRSASYHI